MWLSTISASDKSGVPRKFRKLFSGYGRSTLAVSAGRLLWSPELHEVCLCHDKLSECRLFHDFFPPGSIEVFQVSVGMWRRNCLFPPA
jgi:hypothetical protein